MKARCLICGTNIFSLLMKYIPILYLKVYRILDILIYLDMTGYQKNLQESTLHKNILRSNGKYIYHPIYIYIDRILDILMFTGFDRMYKVFTLKLATGSAKQRYLILKSLFIYWILDILSFTGYNRTHDRIG